MKLWRTAERYDPQRGRLETWVLLTARSLAIDSLRAACWNPVRCRRSGSSLKMTRSRSRTSARRSRTCRPARAGAMASLSPEQRSALELAYFGGRTTAEVAALEGIPRAP